MASNHINHRNSRGRKTENTHSLLTADDVLFMPRYESMGKSLGSFIKWYLKGGSIKPLPLNKASIGLCNRTERARTHMRRSEVLYGRKSSSASRVWTRSNQKPDLHFSYLTSHPLSSTLEFIYSLISPHEQLHCSYAALS